MSNAKLEKPNYCLLQSGEPPASTRKRSISRSSWARRCACSSACRGPRGRTSGPQPERRIAGESETRLKRDLSSLLLVSLLALLAALGNRRTAPSAAAPHTNTPTRGCAAVFVTPGDAGRRPLGTRRETCGDLSFDSAVVGSCLPTVCSS